ncbi:MAG: YkgJ family cysteine cluster protein [Verrucomicrobiae bacterium]
MRRGKGEEEKLAICAVREIYAELARRPQERACTHRTECCRFQLTGKTPHLTKGEAMVAAQAWKSTGRKSLPERADGACPLLHPESSRCLIYASRPFGCRTHFCAAAGGLAPRRDVADLIRRLEAVSLGLGSREARPIADALRACL